MNPKGTRRPGASTPTHCNQQYYFRHRRGKGSVPTEEAILRQLLGTAHRFSLWGVDQNLRYLFFNETHRQLVRAFWGREPKTGDKVLERITHASYKIHSANLYSRALSGESVSTEATVRDAEGVDRTFHYVLTPIPSQRSRPQSSGVLVASIETTVVRRQEEALREARADRDFLVHELDHKVKNNIQTAISALTSELDRLESGAGSTVLGSTIARLGTLANLYDNTVSEGPTVLVSLPNHLTPVITSFLSGNQRGATLRLHRRFEHMSLPATRAIALAQLLWELLNALMTETAESAEEPRDLYLLLERHNGTEGKLTVSVSPSSQPLRLPEQLLDNLLKEAEARLGIEEEDGETALHLRFTI